MSIRLLRVAAPACPKCRTRLDEATNTSDGDEPKPGLLTICCFYCLAVLRFTADMGLEECGDLNAGERAAIDRALAALRRAKAKAKAEEVVVPPGYIRCVENMLHAAKDFVASHGTEGLLFTLPSLEVMLVSGLDARSIDLLAATTKAREFLAYVDEQTGHEATAAQACFVVRHLALPFEEWNNDKLAAVLGGAKA